MESFYKALEVLNELYMGGLIESAVNNSLTNMATIITYIATILVALTAIALPLTQQSLQWMEDKYSSESLVKYLNQKAPISADSIVPRVLIYMVLALVVYVVSEALPTIIQVFTLLLVIAYFGYVVIMYAMYFSYVFQNLSSSTYIHEKILDKTQNLSELTTTEVAVLMDIEGARLKNSLEVISLTEQTRKLGYSLKNDKSGKLVEHMKCYITGLYKILYGLPTDASQKKYTEVASLLSYFSFQLLGDKRYEISLNTLREIAIWIEVQRSDSYKPFLSARFLMELPFAQHKHNIDINELINYTKFLISLARDEKQNVIEELYERLCDASNSNRYETRLSLCYFFHDKIKANLWQSQLSQHLEPLLTGDESNVTKEQIVEALESAEVDVNEDINKLVDEFVCSLWDIDFRCAIEQLSYSFLFYLNTREGCLLSLRDLVNSLKSDIHKFSSVAILPNSIEDIFTTLVGAQNLEFVEFWDSPKEKIIHSCGVLLVYEIVKCQFQQVTPSFNARSFAYGDLDFLLSVVGRWKACVKNIVVISEVATFITSHYSTVEEVLCIAEGFIRNTEMELKKYKVELEESGPLNNKVVDNLKQVYLDAIDSNPVIPVALKNVKLANQSIHTFRGKFPRVTFLKDTNTHFDFSNLGATTVKKHLTEQFFIILHKRGTCFLKNFPKTKSNIELVILTPSVKDYLSTNGFKFSDYEIYWVNGSKAKYFTVDIRAYYSFYCATSSDTLFKFQIGKQSPFEFELADQGKLLESKASFLFTANV